VVLRGLILSQVVDYCTHIWLCVLFMCKCCLRKNVDGDRLKLGLGGTEVLELSLRRNLGSIGQ
jgi:hypothetical protein